MASIRSPLAQWGANLLSQASRRPSAPPIACIACQARPASAATNIKYRRKDRPASGSSKKKKERNAFRMYDLKDADRFALVDAMR
ncbi:MAG: hypothetical protein INR71_12240 [Terriglobus roseus]|nr:hypothetical protein [Terriglobus roseus]